MRSVTLLAVLLCAIAAVECAITREPHLWRLQDLNRAKQMIASGGLQSAYDSLIDSANAKLSVPMYSVMNKTLAPPSGDLHDYMSIAIYNWPCNATPPGCKPYPGGHWPPCDNATGMPWRPCDGIRDEEAIEAGDSPSAGGMEGAVTTLSLAYYMTHNETFANKACSLLDGWMLDPGLRMTPTLKYGQGTPGQTNGSGGGMIEFTWLPSLTDAAVLLQNASCWDDDKAQSVQQWFADLLHYIRVDGYNIMHREEDMMNNHGTWYDSTVQGLALMSDNSTVAQNVARDVASHRIDKQIKPNGQMPLETARTNGAAYSMYNLLAYSNVAVLANYSGVDIWGYESQDGRSVRRALDYLLPFALGKQKWPFPEIETPDWCELMTPLRYASLRFSNATYEEYAHSICGSPGYEQAVLNLIVPPVFNVTTA